LKRYIVIIGILLIIIYVLDYSRVEKLEAALYEVMSQRIEIIEKAAFGETSYDEAQRLLVDITQNPLLKSDLQIIENLDEFPTEIDRVQSFNIGQIRNLSVIGNNICFSAEIVWNMEGLNGPYTEESVYFFEMKKDKDKYLLYNYYSLTNN